MKTTLVTVLATMMRWKNLAVLIFICLAFGTTNCQGMGDGELNSDDLMLRILSHKPQETGSLNDLLKANKLDIKEVNLSTDEALRRMGFKPEKTAVIETFTSMRWAIKRVRVSQNYECLFQYGMDNQSGDYRVTSAAVIPYRNVILRHMLSNDKNWDRVIFKALEPASRVNSPQQKKANKKSVDATARSPVVESESTAPAHHL